MAQGGTRTPIPALGKMHPVRRACYRAIPSSKLFRPHKSRQFDSTGGIGADCVNESEPMQSTIETLCELERLRFFGTLEIKFEAGRVVLLRKTEKIKPT